LPNEAVVTTKKKTKTANAPEAPPDPRQPLTPNAEHFDATLKALKAVLADVPPPAPPAEGQPAATLDLVDAVLHLYFADGLPCGYGQEARRRIAEGFVDRNEFRVTEAFEVEDLLRDLPIPRLFDRCLAVRDSVAQVYNDQNGVQLGFLRDAGIGDRNSFFQRVPALQSHVVHFLNTLLNLEEVLFSDKSTVRAQQRLGWEGAAANKFVDEARALLKPYGLLPLDVGPNLSGGKVNLAHELSPACLLMRLAPAGKRRSGG
jgi:hypothetical protein